MKKPCWLYLKVPQFKISLTELESGLKPSVLTDKAPVFPSKGEMRKLVQSGGVSLNKEKLTDQEQHISRTDLLNDKYLLVQKGKKRTIICL